MRDEAEDLAAISAMISQHPVEAQKRMSFYIHQRFGGPPETRLLTPGVHVENTNGKHGVKHVGSALGGHERGGVVSRPKDPVREQQALEILQFLNLKASKSYRPVEENLRFIRARLNTATPEDIKGVIARKTREWLNTEHAKYLRPATLFNATKFEQYMGEQRRDA